MPLKPSRAPPSLSTFHWRHGAGRWGGGWVRLSAREVTGDGTGGGGIDQRLKGG